MNQPRAGKHMTDTPRSRPGRGSSHGRATTASPRRSRRASTTRLDARQAVAAGRVPGPGRGVPGGRLVHRATCSRWRATSRRRERTSRSASTRLRHSPGPSAARRSPRPVGGVRRGAPHAADRARVRAASITNIVAAYPLAVPAGATLTPRAATSSRSWPGGYPTPISSSPCCARRPGPVARCRPDLGVPPPTRAPSSPRRPRGSRPRRVRAHHPERVDAWQPSRLEHQFSVTAASASGPSFTLIAPSWPGRHLEWSDFDVRPRPRPPPPACRPAGTRQEVDARPRRSRPRARHIR